MSLIEELLIEIECGQNESEERDNIAPKTKSSLGTPIGLYLFHNVINTNQRQYLELLEHEDSKRDQPYKGVSFGNLVKHFIMSENF